MIAFPTPIAPNFSELTGELDQLRQSSRQLSERLIEAASGLRQSGHPPSVGLFDDVDAYRNRLKVLAARLMAADGAALPDCSSGKEEELTFDWLQSVIECRHRMHLAESVRIQLSELSHVDLADFPPLTHCLREAERLCEMSKRPISADEAAEIELLNHKHHPLNALLRLADDGPNLSDQEWAECSDAVTASFGRQLATALTRGRIRRVEKKAVPHDDERPVSSEEFRQPPSLKPTRDVTTHFVESPVIEAAVIEVPDIDLAPVPVALASVAVSTIAFSAVTDAVHVEPRAPSPAPASPAPVPAPIVAVIHQASPITNAIKSLEDRIPASTGTSKEVASQPDIASTSVFDAPRQRRSNLTSTEGLDAGAGSPSVAVPVRPKTSVVPVETKVDHPVPSSPKLPATPIQVIPSRSEPPNAAPPVVTGSTSRGSRISEQIVRLLAENRLPLTLQLNRCLESRPDATAWSPPSWLLRSLILGRNLSYSKGEISRQLDDELRNFRPDMLSEGSEERQIAMGFLLRAAALPAALLTGSGTGNAILRAFKIAPGFSQLYNYCSRIAVYGDRLGDSVMEMFRPSGAIAGATELKELSITARSWLVSAARKATTYSRTSPLFLHAHWTLTSGTAIRHAEVTQIWCKWQETLLLAQRLLAPVFHGLEGERNWVRQEIARLSSLVRVEPLDSTQRGTANSAGAKGIVLPREEMHATLQEAISIATRWLRLCNQSITSGGTPIPVEAIELRDEILNRSDAVISELEQHRNSASSALIRASITCCQTNVRRIKALFESKLTLPLMEADPRHVLNGDLLRIPGIELNDQWLPDADPVQCERELFASFQHPELSWRQSFDYHSQAGNHEATGRLLELDVWQSDEERNALRSTRDSLIADARSLLSAEIDELSQELQSASQFGGQSESEHAAYIQRLEGLRRELPRVLNFVAFRRRLIQLQSAMDRYRLSPSIPVSQSVNAISGYSGDARWMDAATSHAARDSINANDNPLLKESIFHSVDIFSGE